MNLYRFIFISFLATILKIGLVSYEEIIQDNMFNAFVWACLLIILGYMMINNLIRMEGLFQFAGVTLFLMVLAPVQFFKPQLSIIIILIAVVGYMIFCYKEITQKTKQTKPIHSKVNYYEKEGEQIK